MLSFAAERLMEAEVEARTGDPHGDRNPGRLVQRNGYREPGWDTRAGRIELEIPKLSVGMETGPSIGVRPKGTPSAVAKRCWPECRGGHINHGGDRCIWFGGMCIDRAIGPEVIERLQPFGIQAALKRSMSGSRGR